MTEQKQSTGTEHTATPSDGVLVTDHGRTSIADTVVAKIAGIATREVSGVHDLGGGAARVVGAVRDRIPGSSSNMSQGVAVEVGERQTAIDIDLVTEYGVSIADLAAGVRSNVTSSVERMTGLEVTEVNISVHDVYLPGQDDDAEPRESRVE
ncbi:Asp23/Gls24 family envelope stress response protein [uncultured Serinicoccus sp.]|uniref:Asp23/Gls24 family envelope stress response protein n=1 Tax=uncultured Serinicoccus sp. TaxID=735514 RepID=UPI00262C432B|nr:Asp23/Gls24 family envelope stress response protein [uncultured Serinicoccus sp.]